jgi:AraC-like DNA-binding protein
MPSVRIYLPAEDLRGHVTFYYFVESAAPLSDFLYPEWGNVRFAVSGEWHAEMAGVYPSQRHVHSIFGPTDRCGRVSTSGGKVVGFGMTPLGWLRLIDGDASLMANRVRPYDGELGVSAHELAAAFAPGMSDEHGVARLDRLLTAVVTRRPPEHPLVLAADRVLRTRPVDVSAFADAVGISQRTLHRLCLRTFGFPPKRLLRRQRFLDTLGQYRSAVGAPLEASLDAEYNDQPHFYRDFRDFMGMSPRAYFAAERELMAQAAAAQQAAGVTLSFQLPPA